MAKKTKQKTYPSQQKNYVKNYLKGKKAIAMIVSQEELIVAALEAIAQGRYNPCQEQDSSK